MERLEHRHAAGRGPRPDHARRYSRYTGNRHVFDAPNFELRQAGSHIAIPFLKQTSGSAIIARNMRMEAWSNNTVRVMARNISAATFDLAAVTLSLGVVQRRVP